MKRLTIRLRDLTFEELQDTCQGQGISRSRMIDQALCATLGIPDHPIPESDVWGKDEDDVVGK